MMFVSRPQKYLSIPRFRGLVQHIVQFDTLGLTENKQYIV